MGKGGVLSMASAHGLLLALITKKRGYCGDELRDAGEKGRARDSQDRWLVVDQSDATCGGTCSA